MTDENKPENRELVTRFGQPEGANPAEAQKIGVYKRAEKASVKRELERICKMEFELLGNKVVTSGIYMALNGGRSKATLPQIAAVTLMKSIVERADLSAVKQLTEMLDGKADNKPVKYRATLEDLLLGRTIEPPE
jgi:DNA primase large subunit